MVVLASFYNNIFIARLSGKKKIHDSGRSDIKHDIYIDYLMNGQETIPDASYSLIMWNAEGIIRPVVSASTLTWFIRYIITEIYSSKIM